MTRQLLIALGTLAAGALFGLVSPAQAHSDRHDHRHGYHRHEHYRPAPPHVRRHHYRHDHHHHRYYARPHHDHGHYVSRPGHRYVPERWVRDSHGHVVRRPGYWTR